MLNAVKSLRVMNLRRCGLWNTAINRLSDRSAGPQVLSRCEMSSGDVMETL